MFEKGKTYINKGHGGKIRCDYVGKTLAICITLDSRKGLYPLGQEVVYTKDHFRNWYEEQTYVGAVLRTASGVMSVTPKLYQSRKLLLEDWNKDCIVGYFEIFNVDGKFGMVGLRQSL